MVTGIKDRLGRKQAQEQTDRRTKEVLQDRIVYLETEVGKIQEENGRLKALNDELISKIDGVQNRERLQAVEIEKLIGERDDALDRLDKVENMFKGIFHGEKVRSMLESQTWILNPSSRVQFILLLVPQRDASRRGMQRTRVNKRRREYLGTLPQG